MVVFIYDKTFEGLLTAIFDAYFRKTFPDQLLAEGELLPLFCEETVTIYTDEKKANRVWKGLERKLSKMALSSLIMTWLSELPGIDILLFRYIRKTIDAAFSIELNFGDPDVLEISKIWRKVSHERHHAIQFARFQKTIDDTYFSAFEPLYNILPVAIGYFKDRFADQKWLIYDIKREYGYYYDLKEVTEIHFEQKDAHLISGILSEELLSKDEKLFQQLWKQYFQSISIKERRNLKLHRQNMPVRFWKYLPEKQK